MTEKQYIVEDIENMLYQFGVLLSDEFNGLINMTLKKDFYEEYKQFDTITAWDCFVDEVNRIQSVIEFHDFLVDINREDWKRLLERMDSGDVE